MSDLERWLSGGDLTSDGASDQVVGFVRQHLEMVPDLIGGLQSTDDVVRGRAADALEKLGRCEPDEVVEYIELFLERAVEDSVAMVRWHLAMLLGHLSHYSHLRDGILRTLLVLLQDESVFTQSWAIVSLCLVVRQYPQYTEDVISRIASLAQSPSKAIQTKVRMSLPLLTNPETPFPKGWVKSIHLLDIL
jgi:vesicle coat complex subunit